METKAEIDGLCQPGHESHRERQKMKSVTELSLLQRDLTINRERLEEEEYNIMHAI